MKLLVLAAGTLIVAVFSVYPIYALVRFVFFGFGDIDTVGRSLVSGLAALCGVFLIMWSELIPKEKK